MERAARLIRKNFSSNQVFSEEEFTRAVWPAAVGRAISAHTVRLKLVRTTLVVEVEDAIWQKQLYPLTRQILDQIRRVTASDMVRDIEFRVAIPRRQPMRTEVRDRTSVPLQDGALSPVDEAESIRDPMLKKVYRLSRKKATA